MTKNNNRYNYILNFFSSFSGTIASTVIGLVTVPISINYWQADRYGLWALIISITTFFGLTNVGLNSVASILMTKNPNVASRIKILKRAFLLITISVFVFLLAYILLNIYYKGWIEILGKIPDNLKEETYLTCAVFGIFFLINLPFTLITSSYHAFQKIYIDNLFAVGLTIINFINLLIVVLTKGNLTTFALINGVSTLVLNLAKTLTFYIIIYRKIPKESLKINVEDQNDPDTSYHTIIKTSIRFFFITIASMIVVNSDYLIISNMLDVSRITPYSVTFKAYTLVNGIILLANASIFPIMAKEYGNNNWEWINSIYKKTLVFMSIFGGLIWLGGILFMKDIVNFWTGEVGYAGLLATVFLGGYSYILSLINLNSGIMTSFNYLVPMLSWLEAFLKIGLTFFFIKFFDIGGAAMGTFFSPLLSTVWLLPLLMVKMSNHKIVNNSGLILRHFISILLPLLLIAIALQLFTINILLRYTASVSILIIYLILSYKTSPIVVKSFIRDNYLNLKSKIVINRRV